MECSHDREPDSPEALRTGRNLEWAQIIQPRTSRTIRIMSNLSLSERIEKLERFAYKASQDSLPEETNFQPGEQVVWVTQGAIQRRRPKLYERCMDLKLSQCCTSDLI